MPSACAFLKGLVLSAALSASSLVTAATSSSEDPLAALGSLISTGIAARQAYQAGGTGSSGLKVSASEASSALADCLYRNTSSSDKTIFLQWAFVTLGKTSAAQSITKISSAKTTEVEKKAQSSLSRIVVKSCPKEAASLVLSDPKNGLSNTLTALANKMVAAEISRRTSSLLNLTITDLIGQTSGQ